MLLHGLKLQELAHSLIQLLDITFVSMKETVCFLHRNTLFPSWKHFENKTDEKAKEPFMGAKPCVPIR